ncbi:MAG: nucleotidyltransferase domain-containing protein [Bacillota bacterium]
MVDQDIVKKMTQRIVERFAPPKIIAFGSWARGETGPDSDIDFLVIMPYTGSKRDWQVAIRRELKDFQVPKDIIVATNEEIEQKKDDKRLYI